MNTSTAGCIRHQSTIVTQGVPHTIPSLHKQHSNTTMTWRTGKDVPSLLNRTPLRFHFCDLHISKAHQAPRNHSNIQSTCCAISLGPCSLVSNSVKLGISIWTVHSLSSVMLLLGVHTFPFSTGLSFLGDLCPRVSIGCPRCPSAIMARRAAPPIPGSTSTAPRLRHVGEVTSYPTHRQMPPWVLGG